MVPRMIKTKHLRQGDTVFSGEFFLPPACVNTLLLITIPPVVVILLQQGASCLLFSFYGAVHTQGAFLLGSKQGPRSEALTSCHTVTYGSRM